MSDTQRLYFLGLVTLVVFPLPAIGALWFFADQSIAESLDLQRFIQAENLLGLAWGVGYALLILGMGNIPYLSRELEQQNELLAELNLSWIGILFLSICAGVGEELLFRAGVQHWLGNILTTLIFIAIHGYLNPKKRLFFFGLALVPFIYSLGYYFDSLGVWFCVAAHASYDFTLLAGVKYLHAGPAIPSA